MASIQHIAARRATALRQISEYKRNLGEALGVQFPERRKVKPLDPNHAELYFIESLRDDFKAMAEAVSSTEVKSNEGTTHEVVAGGSGGGGDSLALGEGSKPTEPVSEVVESEPVEAPKTRKRKPNQAQA